MKIKAVIEDEDGGYWAEVPALPGCATQGETMDELIANLREAITGVLTVEVEAPLDPSKDRILEIAL
jgi:predicted RNase H-like HicB family nuclease